MPLYVGRYEKTGIPLLQKGDVIVVDGQYYGIESVEDLRYQYTTSTISAGESAVEDMRDLQPSNDEIYLIEQLINTTGDSGIELQYPRGRTRGTPHGLSNPITSAMTPMSDTLIQPYVLSIWIKPGTYPSLYAVNTGGSGQTVTAWFFGWKFRVQPITEEDVRTARAFGKTVYEVNTVY